MLVAVSTVSNPSPTSTGIGRRRSTVPWLSPPCDSTSSSPLAALETKRDDALKKLLAAKPRPAAAPQVQEAAARLLAEFQATKALVTTPGATDNDVRRGIERTLDAFENMIAVAFYD